MELWKLTALELGALLQTGKISAVEATDAALERIFALQPDLNAFITVGSDGLAQAKAAQKCLKPGASLLAGVPMALKDNICTKGVRTTCASKILGEFVPPYSATAVDRLEDAGCVTLGKLNMDEFAMGSTSETSYFGPVKNPWDTSRVPGGSSGGGAAAVASGMCWYAIGSDTGGSIRQPAALCGVTGMKPTYGMVSRYGLIAYASSLDRLGPIARSAADCAAVLDVMVGRDAKDSTSLDVSPGGLRTALTGNVGGLRIGLPAECFGDGLDPEIHAAILAAARVLEARGAQMISVSLPELRYALPAYYILASAEASSNLSRFDGVKYGLRAKAHSNLNDLYTKTRTDGFGAETRRRIILGTFVLCAGYYDAYYQKALRARAVLKRAYDGIFERCDLLLTPVTPTSPPRLGESLSDPLKMYLSDIYTVPVNLAGLPALSMPCGFDRAGMPIGAQLIGPALADGAVLNAAYAYQRATEYHRKTPELSSIFNSSRAADPGNTGRTK